MNKHVILEPLSRDGHTVIIAKPANKTVLSLQDLMTYIETNKDVIDALRLEHGAVLFRGFDINDKEEFLKVKDLFSAAQGFDYVDGNSPRTKLTTGVYTSTEYPQEYSISLHNELSYSNKWPGLIFFFCKTAAEEGGETPIADCRLFLKQLDNSIVDRFEKYGVKYTRYLAGKKGAGKSWMDTFETPDKSVVEEYCRSSNIEFSWDGDNLFLSQMGNGVAEHPITKDKVWFNQANQFHPSGLPDDIYKMLKIMYAKNVHKFPQYAFYGNGEEIPEKDLRDITAMQFECSLKFPWEKGDLLMLDNMLMAHGRMPFKGDRKIYVSMC